MLSADGAEELKSLRAADAVTVAHDRETSAMHGMPGKAIQRGGACHILPAHAIAAMLCSLLSRPTQPVAACPSD
jgi:two-component system, chemotaxis family, protein-glutamate methylesterase/glutaminase